MAAAAAGGTSDCSKIYALGVWHLTLEEYRLWGKGLCFSEFGKGSMHGFEWYSLCIKGLAISLSEYAFSKLLRFARTY